MKRWIKVNKEWIDTLKRLKEGYYYFEIDKVIYCLTSDNREFQVGKLQEESDNEIR